MFEQLVEIMEQMAEEDITATANYRAIVIFKDRLLNQAVDPKLSHRIAMGAKFELTGEFTDDDLMRLIDPLSTIAAKMIFEFLDEGFSLEDLMTLGTNFNIQLDK